jgi:hypothetical protein
MGRYDLRLRSIYDPNEQTGGEQFQRGIGAAIAEKENDVAADNARRAQGQVLTKQTGVADRARGMVNRVRGAASGIAGMIHPEATPPFVQPSPAAVNAGIAAGVTPPTQPAMNTAAPGLTPSYPQPVAPPMTPAQHGLAGARPAGAPGVGGIASAIQPYDEQDTHGNTWSVDPLHAAKVAEAGRSLGEEDKIAALTAAGMPEAEARARVLNNVVRYDETFGQRPRSTGVSQKDWLERQQVAQRDRIELERMRQSGKISTREYQQRNLELKSRELDIRESGQGMAAEGRYTNTEQGQERIDYSRGKEPDPVAASMETPEAKAGRVKANASGDKHAKNVAAVQERRKNALVTDPATLLAERKRLIGTGMTKEQATADMRARGYNVQ